MRTLSRDMRAGERRESIANFSSVPLSAKPDTDAPTTTPIKPIIVIFQENCSFDQYFGSYPNVANLPGENPFHALPNTPTVNNLQTAGLLTSNPNSAMRSA